MAEAAAGSSSYKPGKLTKLFVKAAWFGVGIATGLMIMDPISELIHFPFLHGVAGNGNAQAAMAMIQDYMGWFPEMMGWSGDGGLMNMEWMQALLEPYMAPDMTALSEVYPEGLTLEDLG